MLLHMLLKFFYFSWPYQLMSGYSYIDFSKFYFVSLMSSFILPSTIYLGWLTKMYFSSRDNRSLCVQYFWCVWCWVGCPDELANQFHRVPAFRALTFRWSRGRKLKYREKSWCARASYYWKRIIPANYRGAEVCLTHLHFCLSIYPIPPLWNF